MTAENRISIKKLRLEGMGYKAIASALGLTRDRVRSFCKANKLDGDSVVVSLNHDININRNIICVYCSKPLRQKEQGRNKRFCCDECRRKWWKENHTQRNMKETAFYTYTCNRCSKEFKAYGNASRKFCSHECYIKLRFYKEEC